MWRGTLLDCSSSDNTIVLLHNRFGNESLIETCNNGAVVARPSLYDSEEGWYTSQLNVSITLTSIEDTSTVECCYDDGMSEHNIGHYTFDNDLTFCTNFSDRKGTYISIVVAA